MRLIKWAVLVIAVAVAGCDDSAKKAEEAKKAAEAVQKLAADKAKEAEKLRAEAEAKVKEEAKKAVDAAKGELTKKITDVLTELDAKATALKEKAAKLPKAAKAKAEVAFKAYDDAKATVEGLKTQVESAADAAGLAELTGKVTEALDAVSKAFAGAEAAVPGKKK